MTSSTTVAATRRAAGGKGGALTLGNRFLVSVVAFQRSKQLEGGARPRIEKNGHKATQLAVREVLADTVSWAMQDTVPAVAGGG